MEEPENNSGKVLDLNVKATMQIWDDFGESGRTSIWLEEGCREVEGEGNG